MGIILFACCFARYFSSRRESEIAQGGQLHLTEFMLLVQLIMNLLAYSQECGIAMY